MAALHMRPAPTRCLRLACLCLLFAAVLPSCRAQEVESGFGPLAGFEFHSGFWVNLHHFRYHEARARAAARNARSDGSKTPGPVLKLAPGSADPLSAAEPNI